MPETGQSGLVSVEVMGVGERFHDRRHPFDMLTPVRCQPLEAFLYEQIGPSQVDGVPKAGLFVVILPRNPPRRNGQ